MELSFADITFIFTERFLTSENHLSQTMPTQLSTDECVTVWQAPETYLRL